MKRLFLTVALVLFVSPHVFAQKSDERFELGQRLRAFETALEAQNDEAARKRAVAVLKPATLTFLAGRNKDAARMLDEARFALVSDKEPAAEVRWAASLGVRATTKLVDAKIHKLPIVVQPFYEVKTEQPAKAQAEFKFLSDGKKVGVPLTADLVKGSLETDLALDGLDEGDFTLRCEIVVDKKVLAASEQNISIVKDLSARLDKLKATVKDGADKPKTTDSATLVLLLDLLGELDAKKPQETNYPAARLLGEAEGLVAALKAGETYYGRKKTGQFWLTLMADKPAPVRLLAPAAAKKGEPLPLVIALHGLGGSENMFFDGYGSGLAAKLCEERGWLLVATREGQTAGVVDAVDKLYPVDKKRVFIVGHSMGAAQAVTAAGAKPEQFLAVAALGGGGSAKKSDALKNVAFFIGVGKEDFALTGARSLHASLKKADVQTLEMKEYPDVEHITVVQLGLRDVFAFFDAAAKKNAGK